jgi:Cu+-exporting ATPase
VSFSGAAATAALGVDLAPRTVGGVTVALQAPGTIKAGQETSFTFALTRDGQPLTDLQPYLGAAAHVAIVSAGASEFVHAHGEAGGGGHDDAAMEAPPAQFGPEVSFNNTFARPGLYKLWGQFNANGQVITVPFVVEVR